MDNDLYAYTIVGLRVSKDLVDDIFNHLDLKCDDFKKCESNVHKNCNYCYECIKCLEQFFEYSVYQDQYMDDIYVYCMKTKIYYNPTETRTIPWNWITKDRIDKFFDDMKAIKNRKGISVYEKYKDEEDKMGIHNVVSYS
jgi:hypothetical protein